ncbi:MAG: hypothetical protein NNA25_13380 [Nitrospira sp.]|nr:hypothetical protein [Nitrospira sp.]
MVDVTTDEGRMIMIGIGVAGVALFLVARVIGLMIQRKGERGHGSSPASHSPSDARRPAETEHKESTGVAGKSDRRV